MSAVTPPPPARPARLLVVVAHPGDEAAWIERHVPAWVRQGAVAHLVCGTSGELAGDDTAADPLQLAAHGEQQQRASAEAAGFEAVTFLHRPHGALVSDLALREQLVRIIRDFRPDAVAAFDPRVIFAADGDIEHVDHRELGQATLDAVDASAVPLAFGQLARSEGLAPHRVGRLLLFSGAEIILPGSA